MGNAAAVSFSLGDRTAAAPAALPSRSFSDSSLSTVGTPAAAPALPPVLPPEAITRPASPEAVLTDIDAFGTAMDFGEDALALDPTALFTDDALAELVGEALVPAPSATITPEDFPGLHDFRTPCGCRYLPTLI